MRTDFTRSNVAESTLDVSSPGSSSFDHYHRHHHGLPLGKFIPVMCKPLMPNSVLAGNVAPQYTLETVGTPQIGPIRQDTHTIAVSFRRINRDWRMLVEGKSGFDSIPQFNVSTLFERVLSRLCALSGGLTPIQLLDDCCNADHSFNGVRLYSVVVDQYREFIDGSGDFGYLKDWFAVELSRLSSLEPDSHMTFEPFMDLFYEICKPYFGNNSILDCLRYPIFSYYGVALESVKAHYKYMIQGRAFKFSDYYQSADHMFRAYFDLSTATLSFSDPESYVVNEMPLRAQYAAWYDSLRNWHVEERNNLPDPDLWGSSSLLGVADLEHFYFACCLLLPRYRCYGSDAFTTVQTDAAFRHVFNPIFENLSGTELNVAETNESFVIGNLYSVLINGVSHVFPQGLFRRSEANSATYDLWINDLKTMRRSGMLERYLARDYFFPDTYEGQMRARYGIEPSDLIGVSSQYISGTETFISGDQQIASTNGTDGVTGTPAGTRTFTGGAASNGVVQFSSQGDFVFLVTFSSLQPIVSYDSKDMFLSCLTRADLPFPEFADDANVMIQARDMIRGLESNVSGLGYVPRYYGWRTDLDSAHGPFLREYRSFIWLRDFKSQYGYSGTLPFGNRTSPFAITAYGLHVHLPLDAFNGAFKGDDLIVYGDVTFNYSIQAPLPAAVQHI